MAKKRPVPGPARPTPIGDLRPDAIDTVGTIGERRNYNLQPGVTHFRLWPFSTIEWVADKVKYRARVIIENTITHNNVAFNSWHQDFSDAERAIALVSESLGGTAPRRVYNIFGETIDVHLSHVSEGAPITVTEVQALIWSMQQY